jgi:hypothetical protein
VYIEMGIGSRFMLMSLEPDRRHLTDRANSECVCASTSPSSCSQYCAIGALSSSSSSFVRGTDGREIKEFDWSVMIIALHILLTIVIFLLEPELELWGDTSPTMNRFRDPSPAAGKSQGEGKEEVGEVHLSESRPSNPQCW